MRKMICLPKIQKINDGAEKIIENKLENDFPDRVKTLGFLDRFTDRKPFVKVGMELFYAEGHSLVEEIKRRGHNIFLDLKLHDIPNTVGSAMKIYGCLRKRN